MRAMALGTRWHWARDHIGHAMALGTRWHWTEACQEGGLARTRSPRRAEAAGLGKIWSRSSHRDRRPRSTIGQPNRSPQQCCASSSFGCVFAATSPQMTAHSGSCCSAGRVLQTERGARCRPSGRQPQLTSVRDLAGRLIVLAVCLMKLALDEPLDRSHHQDECEDEDPSVAVRGDAVEASQ